MNTIESLMDKLAKLGYEAYVPRTSSWQTAFAARNQTGTLIILIRRRGIDFKIYDSIVEFRTDRRGKLYTDGGKVVRNYYYDSDVSIFAWILEVATKFIADVPLGGEYLVGQGRPWSFDQQGSTS